LTVADRLTIQRQPRALLDWLGMKGSGDTPHTLADYLQSTMEVGGLFLQDRALSIIDNTGNISTNGWSTPASANSVCPAGEMWIINSLTVYRTSALPAATGWTAWAGVYRIYNGSSFVVCPTPVVIPAAGMGATGQTFRVGDLILNPGDRPAVFTASGTYTTPSPMTFAMEYYRLTV
jgi:hypothetical protein